MANMKQQIKRYKNDNGGKAAFPAKIAAKSAQNVQKSGQNA